MKKLNMNQILIDKFKNLSISKQFTVSLMILLILPFSILFLWISLNVTSQIREKNSKTNLEILKQTKASISYMIGDTSYISLEVLGNTALQNYFNLYDELEIVEKEKLAMDCQYQIDKLLESRNYISHVSIFNNKQTFFQFGSYLLEENLIGIDEAAKQKGKSLWLPAYMEKRYLSRSDRVYEVTFIRAINDFTKLNHILAYEKINIPESYLCSLYSGIKSIDTKNMFLVDEQGNILSSIDKKLLGKSISNSNMILKMQEMQEGYYINQKQLVSFYKINYPGWYVVKIDNINIVQSGQLTNSIILTCIVLTMIFGICFLYIQRRQIINPVTALSKEVSKFRDGQYTLTIHKDSKDEIGELNKCFVEMGIYIQDLIEREYKSKLSEKEAQLMYLQSQINPHFLYNTLDSIRWMAIKEKQMDIAIQIEALSNLFKHALNQGNDMTTLEKEVEHLKNYLTIQKNRFGDLLEVKIEVDDEIKNCPVLNLILQPLVENSIEHGIGEKLGQGEIQVMVKREGSMIHYIVEDNGLGTDEQIIQNKLNGKEKSNNALALVNINKRIKYKYGEECGILFTSEIGVGTKVEILIPMEEYL